MWRFRKSIEERQNNRWPARRMSGGCAARRFPMWTESWRACGEILHNSVDHAARSLKQAPTRPDVTMTSRGLTIGTIGRDLTIATMGQGLTTTNSAPPLPMIATRSVWNGVVVDHQRSRDGCWYLDTGTPSRNSCPTGSNAKERCSGSKCHNIKC